MEAEECRFVSDRIPVRKDEDWPRAEFHEKGEISVLYSGGEFEGRAVLKESRNWALTASHVKQELAVVAETAE